MPYDLSLTNIQQIHSTLPLKFGLNITFCQKSDRLMSFLLYSHYILTKNFYIYFKYYLDILQKIILKDAA